MHEQHTTPALIVAGTDLSPGAEAAVEQAAALAGRWQGGLCLLHVFNDSAWSAIKNLYTGANWSGPDPVSAARQRLSRQVLEVGGRHAVAVHGETRNGAAAAEMARHAQDCGARLLVVGEHGSGWVGDALLGSTALKVLEQARVPVLLVRRPFPVDRPRVLVGVDFSENAERAVLAAARFFPQGQLCLAHASQLYPSEDLMRLDAVPEEEIEGLRSACNDAAAERMEGFCAGLALPEELDYQVELLVGHPKYALVDLADTLAADLLVVGRHGQGYVDERLFGSLTQYLLLHARCSVLLVP